jgi:adenylosuccinate synthase
MTVSRDDLHALDQKINDHKLEVYKAMTEAVAGPMTRLSEEIREMTGEFKGVKESTGRFSKELKESQDKIVKLSERVILVEAKQGTIIGITGKVFPYFVMGMVALIPALLGANLWITKVP